MNNSENIFLLTRNTDSLNLLRNVFQATGMPIFRNCALGALQESCRKKEGCVVLSANDYSNDEICKIVQALRNEKLPHAVVIVDPVPSFTRAREILHLPVHDYFQLATSPAQIILILKSAIYWSKTQGKRLVQQLTIKDTWETLDDSLKEVLTLLYNGKTNKEIADELNLSLRAIENRRAKLTKIFQVTSFAALIRVATTVFDPQ
ncbi:MAG: LuxR C-terminal-related transcriptional regulator [Planctomycetia bacterium]|nr:LuxR C-terminal-related transcriptional regulator [Planctomycetia bacterium]